MKRIGNLYEIVCSKDTIHKAIHEASRGKKKRRDVQKILANEDFYVDRIHRMLVSEKFIPTPYIRETICDGSQNKVRNILKPRFYPDQIVHWCIYLAFREPFYRGMYVFSCGSIPDRGVHYGKKYVQKWVRDDRKNTKYYLKMDIKKFYPSVKPWRLMQKLERKIKDQKFLRLMRKILFMSDGLPIGILLSQILANFFMNEVDYYIKQELVIHSREEPAPDISVGDKKEPTDKDVNVPTKTGTFWDDSEFFDREEFRCQCKGKYCNGFPVEPEEELVRVCNEIRRRLGVPVQIVDAGGSGVRCEQHNANVGGVANSNHKYGKAADLHSSKSPEEMAQVAESVMGKTGEIGIYSWGIHVGVNCKYSRFRG